MQTLNWPFAPVSHGTLGLGTCEKLGALEVVEIGQAVKRVPLGLRQYGQPSTFASARRLVGLQWASVGWKGEKTFPITSALGKVACRGAR